MLRNIVFFLAKIKMKQKCLSSVNTNPTVNTEQTINVIKVTFDSGSIASKHPKIEKWGFF